MPTTPVTRRIGGQSTTKRTGMRMPHERDESSTDAMKHDELEPVQAEQMEQARQDMEGPQQDTDCRSVPQPEGSACSQPEIDTASTPGPGDEPGTRPGTGSAGEDDRDRRAGSSAVAKDSGVPKERGRNP